MASAGAGGSRNFIAAKNGPLNQSVKVDRPALGNATPFFDIATSLPGRDCARLIQNFQFKIFNFQFVAELWSALMGFMQFPSRATGALVFLIVWTLQSQAAGPDAPRVRSVPPAKNPPGKIALKRRAVPLAPTFKSHVHQRTVELPALSPATVQDLKRQDVSEAYKRLRIGVARDFSEPVLVNAQTVSAAAWAILPDGSRIWTLQITSRGAIGLRVHVESQTLDDGASLIVYDPSNPETTAAPVPAETPGTDDGVWAETIFAENVVIECQLPPGVATSAASFSVTEVSHRYRGLKSPGLAAGGPCEHDVVCAADWLDVAAGVASIDFIQGGQMFVCTGCLLNDADPETFANYFLTARHCVPNKTVAATLEARWFYQRTGCDDFSAIDSRVTTTSGGADLLATGGSSDFAFLRLRQNPPDGAVFEGWSTAVPGFRENVTTIHHPEGFEKKISFGVETGTDDRFWKVQWDFGVTEGGSSGCPLFNADDSNRPVIGQLLGGASSCDNPGGEDVYGRFDLTHKKIRKWIDNYAFLRVQGSYNGLFAEADGAATRSAGFLTLTLREQGSYSGSLQLAGKRYSLSGQFNDSGVANNNVMRSGANPLAVQMTLGITPGDERLTGTVSDGTWTANLLARRAAFNVKTNPAPLASKYTLILPGVDSTQAPRGHGYAALSVDLNGKARVSGSLSDGTRISQSVPVAPDRTLPLYANLYGGKGVLEGWLSFNDSSPATDLDGSVGWVKDAQPTARFYPGGFALDMSAVGELYSPSLTPIIPITTGTIFFSGGNFTSDFSNDVTISPDNKISNESANKLSLSFVLSSGVFNGSVTPPSGSRGIPFHGVVLQGSGLGYGYFLGSSESGSVVLEPR
jgi:hypothetical protein